MEPQPQTSDLDMAFPCEWWLTLVFKPQKLQNTDVWIVWNVHVFEWGDTVVKIVFLAIVPLAIVQ